MNLIQSTINNNFSKLSIWVEETPILDMIDTVTYDLYEGDNPFRQVEDENIDNKYLKTAVNVTSTVGAEFYSIFTNPYYLTHKIVSLPAMYEHVTDIYKKYSINNSNKD